MGKLHAPTGRPDAAAADIIRAIHDYASAPIDSDDAAFERIESLRHIFFEAECAWEQSLDDAKNVRMIGWKRMTARLGYAMSTLQGRINPGAARPLRSDQRVA